MQCAIVIHLMAGRDKVEIEEHFELSRQRISQHIQTIQRRLIAVDPKSDPTKSRASLSRMSRSVR